jgi:hypothetical protein
LYAHSLTCSRTLARPFFYFLLFFRSSSVCILHTFSPSLFLSLSLFIFLHSSFALVRSYHVCCAPFILEGGVDRGQPNGESDERGSVHGNGGKLWAVALLSSHFPRPSTPDDWILVVGCAACSAEKHV